MKTAVLLDFDRAVFDCAKFDADHRSHKVRGNYVLFDAKRFIAKVKQQRGISLIIFTQGEPDFQQLKLKVAGLNHEKIIITPEFEKVRIIKRYLDGTKYLIDGVAYDNIIFVDDKSISFKGFGNLPRARGWCVRRFYKVNDLSEPNVKIVDSLDEIDLRPG